MVKEKTKIPLHVQAEETIKQMIASPEYQSGKLLPNEIDLAKELNISRNTLRQALNKLVFEGRLCRRKGYGTWATQKTITSGVQNWLSFSQEMKAMGYTVKNYELHVIDKIPPLKIKKFFNIPEEDNTTRCLRLKRVRGHEEFPFVVFISYFNPIFKISADEDFSKPLYEVLEKKYGIVVKTSVEEVAARLAGHDIASELGISDKDPILVRKRLVYDTNHTPIEYNVGYYRADSFTYSITAQR